MDGRFWATLSFPHNGAWHERVFDVPEGKHTYTFTARADQDTSPAFALDSFVCEYAEPRPGANMQVDFENGFVPVETDGDWLVDNVSGSQGDAAIHPPWMEAGDEAQMTFDCADQVHTRLKFYGFNANGVGGPVDVAVDGEPPQTLTFPHNGAWHEQVFDVPEGEHTYTFTVHAEQDTSPSFALDSFVCE